MSALWELSAHELTRGYAKGDFTPLDALNSVLERCDAVNPGINAVICRNDVAAREMAQASSDRWRAGAPVSDLDGVPISVKDNLLVKGFTATWGTRAFRDFRPEADEVPVARLRAAGAVFFAKTNVPELTLQGYTDNLLFGPTGLPFAPDLTPGGSSGGAAAAVAAGIGPLALGTDGGGSIRRPAAHAGLYGLKPGAGRVDRGNGFPAILGAFEVVGPIGRDIRDVRTMFRCLLGRPGAAVAAGPKRILYARHFSGQPVDPDILARTDEAAQTLAGLGHEVSTVESFDATAALDRIWPVISSSGVAWLAQSDASLAEGLGKDVRAMADAGSGLGASDYAGAMVRLEEMRLAYRSAMQGHDLLMTPAIAAFSWPKAQSHPAEIAGTEVGPRGHAVFTAFANALGLAALTIPLWPGRVGLPCGVQIVGEPMDEELLLGLAAQVAGV